MRPANDRLASLFMSLLLSLLLSLYFTLLPLLDAFELK
jgi:hypothetical protein